MARVLLQLAPTPIRTDENANWGNVRADPLRRGFVSSQIRTTRHLAPKMPMSQPWLDLSDNKLSFMRLGMRILDAIEAAAGSHNSIGRNDLPPAGVWHLLGEVPPAGVWHLLGTGAFSERENVGSGIVQDASGIPIIVGLSLAAIFSRS